ncbi:MAG: branched-chain amino acid ABC transporter substrate-binding protein [Alphaproteobacteria bacterium]|nr:branched-chain amino acid ABC transporter substrate-binding protein [Alphaproteobacteria bacterium]
MKKYILTCAFAVLTVSPAHAYIEIGLAGPLTGQYASFGEQMARGALQAVADINAKGGINGEMLQMQAFDDACDPKQAVTVANQLASRGIKFVIGHFCSGSSIPASKVYNEENILMISPSSTNPALTDAGLKNIFRVCGRDDQQGAVQAHYLLKHFRDKKIAIIHDNSTGGKGQADQVKKTLNEAGVKEVMFESYMTGQRDYSALIAKLKQLGAQALDIGGYHTEAGLIARQMKEQKMDVQVIGGDALVTDEFWSITGPAGEGVLMTFEPDPRNRPEAKPVMDAIRKTKFEPEGYTLYTYAAVQAAVEGIKRAGAANPAKVEAVLRKEPIKTVIGSIGFNAKGDVTGSNYVVYRWHNGKYAEIKDQP